MQHGMQTQPTSLQEVVQIYETTRINHQQNSSVDRSVDEVIEIVRSIIQQTRDAARILSQSTGEEANTANIINGYNSIASYILQRCISKADADTLRQLIDGTKQVIEGVPAGFNEGSLQGLLQNFLPSLQKLVKNDISYVYSTNIASAGDADVLSYVKEYIDISKLLQDNQSYKDQIYIKATRRLLEIYPDYPDYPAFLEGAKELYSIIINNDNTIHAMDVVTKRFLAQCVMRLSCLYDTSDNESLTQAISDFGDNAPEEIAAIYHERLTQDTIITSQEILTKAKDLGVRFTGSESMKLFDAAVVKVISSTCDSGGIDLRDIINTLVLVGSLRSMCQAKIGDSSRCALASAHNKIFELYESSARDDVAIDNLLEAVALVEDIGKDFWDDHKKQCDLNMLHIMSRYLELNPESGKQEIVDHCYTRAKNIIDSGCSDKDTKAYLRFAVFQKVVSIARAIDTTTASDDSVKLNAAFIEAAGLLKAACGDNHAAFNDDIAYCIAHCLKKHTLMCALRDMSYTDTDCAISHAHIVALCMQGGSASGEVQLGGSDSASDIDTSC